MNINTNRTNHIHIFGNIHVHVNNNMNIHINHYDGIDMHSHNDSGRYKFKPTGPLGGGVRVRAAPARHGEGISFNMCVMQNLIQINIDSNHVGYVNGIRIRISNYMIPSP